MADVGLLVHTTWGGLNPGRYVKCVGGRIPEGLAEKSDRWDGPLPASAFVVDVGAQEKEDRDRAAALLNQPRDCRLTREQLWKKLPWTRDPQKFALATSSYGFPTRTEYGDAHLREPLRNVWSESDVDAWLAAKRVTLSHLREFVGDV